MLKQREIFYFWLPLAFSFLLMTFEGPWVQGVISRKADAELQLAAFGLVMSLSVTIEAPVIMFLAVGSALARDRHAYHVLWRYTMIVNLLVTVVAALMAFTPLLDWWLGSVLNIPQNIIDATRPGMVVMILWSGFIGYRRFHQGILIRNNRTRAIGIGTMIRIIVSAGIAVLVGLLSALPGAVIGALALMFAVTAEMIYTIIVARPDVNQLVNTEPRSPLLTYRSALGFHLPLALTSLMTLLVRPIIERGLAGTPDAALALAAWPVIFAIALFMRSGGMAWQEVVISLCRGSAERQALRRFSFTLGMVLTGLMILLAFTPLIDIYLGAVLNVPERLHPSIVMGTQVAVMLPLLTVLQSHFRGLLMLSGKTSPIYQGMLLSFVLTAAVMWGAVGMGMNGLVAASLAMTLGALAEMAFLWRMVLMNEDRLVASLQPAG